MAEAIGAPPSPQLTAAQQRATNCRDLAPRRRATTGGARVHAAHPSLLRAVQMTMACIGLAIAIFAMPGTQPAIDSAHALMEPPPDPQPRPYVRPPAGSAVAAVLGSGMYRKLVALSRPRSAFALTVAVLLLTCLASPSTASALLLHTICFIGSLVEPFDSVLPNKFFLRPFIAQARPPPERVTPRPSGSRIAAACALPSQGLSCCDRTGQVCEKSLRDQTRPASGPGRDGGVRRRERGGGGRGGGGECGGWDCGDWRKRIGRRGGP